MPRRLLRKITRRLEPYVEEVTGSRWVRTFAPRLADPDLWHINRRSSARAVAIGLFAGLVPGPFQVLGSILLSIMFRANFPLAAITTLYTNPVTIVPLYLVAWRYGGLFVDDASGAAWRDPPAFELSAHYVSGLVDWMLKLGKPLALGLPLLAVTLAALGFVCVHVVWRAHTMHAWRARRRRRDEQAAAAARTR